MSRHLPPVVQNRENSCSYLELLLGRAYETIRGELYNEYRYESTEGGAGNYLFFEMSLTEEHSWNYVRERIFPLFVRYLRAKNVDPATASRVVVAIFHRDRCHLLRGGDFLAAFREIEGLDLSEFHARISNWLST